MDYVTLQRCLAVNAPEPVEMLMQESGFQQHVITTSYQLACLGCLHCVIEVLSSEKHKQNKSPWVLKLECLECLLRSYNTGLRSQSMFIVYYYEKIETSVEKVSQLKFLFPKRALFVP